MEGLDSHLVFPRSLKFPLLKVLPSITHHGADKIIQIFKSIGMVTLLKLLKLFITGVWLSSP
uniref:Macaca fascicularis brain cDNA clone: QflA-17445, similar to human zinc finger protein 264 (ZNF264), mRNA, RefSeq: XM_375660.1 n=1 Tax=Macaca fascicularis TaxID=9541 RepID=I7GI63_MACFA|nr:unnamed protein product [Macaca fascicularis]